MKVNYILIISNMKKKVKRKFKDGEYNHHLKKIKQKEHLKTEREKDYTTILYLVAVIVGIFIGLLF